MLDFQIWGKVLLLFFPINEISIGSLNPQIPYECVRERERERERKREMKNYAFQDWEEKSRKRK
jgi:hypothetical protein